MIDSSVQCVAVAGWCTDHRCTYRASTARRIKSYDTLLCGTHATAYDEARDLCGVEVAATRILRGAIAAREQRARIAD